jgi:hypothetical protein
MFRFSWKKGAIALVVVAVLGSASAAAFIPIRAAQPETLPPANFIVHEWGTFTTFAGSDGQVLRFYPTGDDLPAFVYRDKEAGRKQQQIEQMFSKRDMSMLVSLETPVLYFYADRELTASVDVVFPKGRLTEHYPRSNAAPAGWLRWDGLKILPGAQVDFPTQPGPGRYYAARATDAAPIRLDSVETVSEPTDTTLLGAALNRVFGMPATREVQTTKQEHEKFIFYRGAGNFVLPLNVAVKPGLEQVKIRCGNSFVPVTHVLLKNTGLAPFRGAVLVNIQKGKVRFQEVGTVEPSSTLTASLPTEEATLARLGEVMVRLLMAEGLYEKEAQAMVKTWESAWFGEEGTRLIYIVPQSLTDELLPLRIDPKPDTTVRVLVGRHDFLTPQRERDIDALVERMQSDTLADAERAILQKELIKLGRFEAPASSAAYDRLRQKKANVTQ